MLSVSATVFCLPDRQVLVRLERHGRGASYVETLFIASRVESSVEVWRRTNIVKSQSRVYKKVCVVTRRVVQIVECSCVKEDFNKFGNSEEISVVWKHDFWVY